MNRICCRINNGAVLSGSASKNPESVGDGAKCYGWCASEMRDGPFEISLVQRSSWGCECSSKECQRGDGGEFELHSERHTRV